jgi:VCBS repeat protein
MKTLNLTGIGSLRGGARQSRAVLALTGLVTLAISGVTPAAVAAGSLTFGPPTSYGTGDRAVSVAIGDLNGDGHADLAVANYSSNTVSVLLNNGTGTFGTAANYGTDSHPTSVAIADLNADGKPDLVVTNNDSNDVSVLLNKGDGSFGAAVNYGAQLGPQSVAIADLDGDGKPDLAVANYGQQYVSVLLGNGAGTFKTAVNYKTDFNPLSVAIGDLNSDGKPDLVAVARSGVSVLLGNGDGSFGTAVNYAAHSGPEDVAIADLNGDHKLDLVIANYTSNDVSVLLGNDDGTFKPAVNYAAHSGAKSVKVGDLDGDGKPDLAIANNISSDVSVLLGNGDGTFGTGTNYAAHSITNPLSAPYSVAIGDLNGDNKPDLALAHTNTADATVLLNSPVAADTTPPAISSSASGTVGSNGWYVSDVTVSWTVSDPESTVSSQTGCGSTTISADTTGTTLTCSATSAGGTARQSVTVKRDATPPTISAAATTQPHAAGWYSGDVTVHFACNDSVSGVPAGACPLNQPLSTEGTAVSSTAQTVTDAAGNISSASNVVTVKIDKTAPSVACAAPDGLWHATDVSLGCTAVDALSGLASTGDTNFQLSTSVPAGTETANAATGNHTVADAVGNTTTAGPLGGNKVDKKAPSITLSQPTAATYQLNQAVAASYSCSDGGSGAATCAGPVSNGAALDTSTAGTRTFTVTATDNVGNTSSQGVSYTVTYRFSGFLQPVDNPNTVNTGKAGRTYPIKFQLTDASGAFVSSLGAVKSITYQSTSCGAFSGDASDPLEAEATGGTSLRYDSTANEYVYNWTTPSTKGCSTLFVTLDSGQVFPAYFNLS